MKKNVEKKKLGFFRYTEVNCCRYTKKKKRIYEKSPHSFGLKHGKCPAFVDSSEIYALIRSNQAYVYMAIIIDKNFIKYMKEYMYICRKDITLITRKLCLWRQ